MARKARQIIARGASTWLVRCQLCLDSFGDYARRWAQNNLPDRLRRAAAEDLGSSHRFALTRRLVSDDVGHVGVT